MTDAFDTKNGVSMLLLNTDLAQNIFEKIADRYQVIDMTLEQAIQTMRLFIPVSIQATEMQFIVALPDKDLIRCFKSTM